MNNRPHNGPKIRSSSSVGGILQRAVVDEHQMVDRLLEGMYKGHQGLDNGHQGLYN